MFTKAIPVQPTYSFEAKPGRIIKSKKKIRI
jgi:hypothetical protein